MSQLAVCKSTDSLELSRKLVAAGFPHVNRQGFFLHHHHLPLLVMVMAIVVVMVKVMVVVFRHLASNSRNQKG